MRWWRAVLERAAAEQEVDDVPLVWLEPVEGDRLHRADIEAVDVRRVEQLLRPVLVFGDAGCDQRLPDLLDSVWSRSHARLRDMARRFSVIRNWFFLGRGIYHGLAMEAALKFKEVTYCHAEGMPAGFLKHGTISLIDEAMHTAIFLPDREDEELRTQSLGAVAEINARGGSVVAFQPEGTEDRQGQFVEVIDYPSEGALTAPLVALMQAQLFAYYTARALGRNVDKPRSLAKSVTVG